MPEETAFVEPKTEEIEVRAKLLGDFRDIAKRLSQVQTLEVDRKESLLRVARVESRDIEKRPFMFVLLEFNPDKLVINYTVPADSSPKLRRMDALGETLSVLSLVTELYSVDNVELYQCLDSAMEELVASMSQSYSTLFNNYDSIFNDYRELRKINVELTASNKNLSVEASQLSEKTKNLEARLKELESYSDDSLMVMTQEWLEAHNSEIDVGEFSRVYKVTPTRVEAILNKMVSLGYIELKG
ncbi:MAG: hypothetical protein KGH94_02685 [Candidatus Micrarchaeota archaeon]|nr:hypothetical protein [Candidatus Micrarchaeota archaeon]